MTLPIILALIASLLWGIAIHIDKYMIDNISENGSNIKILLVFSTLVAGIILSPIWLIISNFSVHINTTSLISIFAASLTYIIATIFYYKAMKNNDASIVGAMLQLIPVFSYILGLILFKEQLTFLQLLGSIIIILSSIVISFDFNNKNNKNKSKALLFMSLSSLGYAIYYILFDIAIRNSEYTSCAFWYQVGFLIIGIILILIKSFREPFINSLKRNGKLFFVLNTANEGINLLANLLVNLANVFIPIALANVLTGFQGAFVFIIGTIGTIFFSKYIKEDIRKEIIIQKILCIIMGIIGLIILVYK